MSLQTKGFKILDTNVILLDANNVINLAADGSTIVIPETVLDELDAKKSGLGEINFQARAFGRLLTQATKLDIKEVKDLQIHQFAIGSTRIHVAASSTYPSYADVDSKIINDRRIIEIALQYNNTYGDVLFVSNDVMCRLRAESLGLRTDEVKEIESAEFSFTKTIEVSQTDFGLLHNRGIAELDPDYTPGTYNYHFYCPELGYEKLAVIHSGTIQIIGKDTERELRKQDINPINTDQMFLSRAIQDTSIDIIVCEALSGSGKTAISLSNAMKLVKQNNPYDGILYIRASVDDVDKAEEVGFLPGLEEKFAPYLHPLDDTLDFIARQRNKKSVLKGPDLDLKIEGDIVEMKSKYNITAMTTLGMRGRTFTNTIAIIDEAQNMSKASMQKVLTRFGKNVKVIIIGSNRQIDNAFLSKYTNGLSTILDACTKSAKSLRLHAVQLQKVVRSPIAEWSEKLFSKETT